MDGIRYRPDAGAMGGAPCQYFLGSDLGNIAYSAAAWPLDAGDRFGISPPGGGAGGAGLVVQQHEKQRFRSRCVSRHPQRHVHLVPEELI